MTSSQVILRSATSEDVPQIQEILKETKLYFEQVDGDPNRYKNQLEHNPNSIVIACINETVVGVMMFIYSPLYSVVFHLAVSLKHQRKGIGLAIFKEVLSRIDAMGGSSDISGYIAYNNTASNALCNKLGLKAYIDPLIARYK